jgi:multiple sugar transport system ATP-binding protein
VSTERGVRIAARQSTRTSLKAGDTVGLSFDQAHWHLFDAQGMALTEGI